MKRALQWIRDHALAIAGGIVAILSAVIAVGAFKRRVGSLKDQIAVEKARAGGAMHEAIAAEKVQQEHELARQDAQLAKAIVDESKRGAETAAAVKGKSDADVIRDLNKLYARPPGGGSPAPVLPVRLPPPPPSGTRGPRGNPGGGSGKSGKG